MSDIPVGSPPVPPGRHAASSGWYADPVDQAQERYWDGWQWSRNTRPREGKAPAPGPAAGWPPAQQPGPDSGQQGPYAGQQGPYAGQQGPYAGQQGPYGGPKSPYGGQPGPYGAQQPGAGRPARPAVYTADGVAVASWWWRALGAVLDGLATGLLSLLLTLPLYRTLFDALGDYWTRGMQAARAGQQPPPPPDVAGLITGTEQVLIIVIGLAVGMAYDVVFLRWRAATPGMMICGLRVVPVDEGRSTRRLSWTSVLVRAVVWVLPGAYSPLFFITIADVLLPLWHPKRQSLHDLAARTQVVRARG